MNNKTLTNRILKLKQDTFYSPILSSLKREFIEKIELEAKNAKTKQDNNSFFKDSYEKMLTHVEKCEKSIQSDSFPSLKDLYYEVYIYSKLNSLVLTEKVPETSTSTPDFKIRFNNSDIFIEVKSLNMFDTISNHNSILQDGLNKKIDLQSQLDDGKDIAIVQQVYKPYKPEQHIVKTIVKKINQNVKRSQFEHGDTILLVDMSQLPISHPDTAIYKTYPLLQFNKEVSGFLWHIAFHQLHDDFFEINDREEINQLTLNLEGVLISHPYIKGLIFHIDELFYGFIKSDSNMSELVQYLCPKRWVAYP
jgi:hypothetical protein